MKKTLLVMIMMMISTVVFADFSRWNDIVTDNESTLMWQDDTAAKTVTKTWTEAITYCEDLSLGEYDDWRLPTPMEFVYLCRITEACGTGVEYWTSELEEGGSTNDVITVYLGTGFFELRSAGSDQTKSFKCVR